MSDKCALTRTAEIDLLEIWTYIADKDIDAADRQALRIFKRLDQLAVFPNTGRIRDDLAPGIRSTPVDSYVILYHVKPTGAEVLHIVHGSRDLATLFDTD